MVNKNTTSQGTKNDVVTPNSTEEALANLPFNYIIKVLEELKSLYQKGESSKEIYTKSYIVRVRKGEAYNEDIMLALVNVGIKEIEKRKRFGRFIKKETSST